MGTYQQRKTSEGLRMPPPLRRRSCVVVDISDIAIISVIPDMVKGMISGITNRERVLFIGTQFSNLYTAVDTPARGRVGVCVVFVCKYVLGRSRVSQPLNLRLCLLRHFGFLTSPHASPPCRGRRLNSYRLLRRSTPGPPPNLRAHLLHFPTSPRPPLYTPTITT